MSSKKTVFMLQEMVQIMDIAEKHSSRWLSKLFHVINEQDVESDPSLLDTVEGVVLPQIWWLRYHGYTTRMPSLRAVACPDVGIDPSREYLGQHGAVYEERKVAFGHAPGCNSQVTANLAMTLILASARNIKQGIETAMGPKPLECFDYTTPMVDVAGQVLGIVGMGGIGHQVALRAHTFSMKILYHSRNKREESAEHEVKATYCASLGEMLPLCDYVLISCPLTEHTHHLMGHAQFSLMKPTATIVNIARGKIVETEALVKALQEGSIKGAALDVTEPEPLPREHPLLHLPNVIITPHIGGFTVQSLVKAMDMVIDNLTAVLTHDKSMPYPMQL